MNGFLPTPAFSPSALTPHTGAEAPYLASLNPAQREAVETLDGAVLMLAGAGTGKTKALTTRLAHLLATHRAQPWQILAVTFTNKAAREMKQRIGALVGDVVEGMQWLGTFHAIGARILRRHAELAGLKSNFTILDTDDQIRLLKQLLEAEHIDEKRWPARTLAMIIDGWKNKGLNPADIPASDANDYAGGKAQKLYADYQERLKTLNATDFGDLLLQPLTILRQHPDVLADYRARFRYILVDEYQDTNTVQYLWLKLLAGSSGNVCVVGDDDQSIYGWRGAEVENILRFEKDFPGAKIIRLERNYRSTAAILGAASGLIATNKGRLGKTLWTEDGEGEKVRVQGIYDGEEEARNIAADAEDLHRQGEPYAGMAILVRASFQMREFEDRFIALGLPYRVIGGPRFYERAEIRDALAYMRIVAQGDDDLAFERIVNKPKRGIGDASVQTLQAYARARALPLLAAAREIVGTDEIPPKARRSLAELAGNFERWTEASHTLPHTDLAELILDESGYTAMLKADKSVEAPGKLDNLKELVRSMESFETLAAFLEHVSLVMEIVQSDDEDRLSLMTLHAAKGLEFDTVFLPGWEEGLFPSQRTMDEHGLAGLEEERRLAYVGITRAKKRARIFFAANRRVHGSWQNAMPSRFLSELPPAHVEAVTSQGVYGADMMFRDNSEGGFAATYSGSTASGGSYNSPGWKRAQNNMAQANMARGHSSYARPALLDAKAVHSTQSDLGSQFKSGERVFHQKFGYGRIRSVDGNKLTVAFDKAGEKKVIDQFVTRA
ncbi:MAG: UvrD-helicase domain-containing protein [Rhizomicrobium sp.]